MSRNRLLDQHNSWQEPSSAPQGFHVDAFVMCPVAACPAVGGQQPTWQQTLYQMAFEQAQAATRRPSLFERDWLGVWN